MTADTADRAGDSVLGTLLRFYKPELIVMVQAKGVSPKDFWRERQRVLYRAVLALHAQGSHVDPLTLEAFLEQHDCLQRAGGRAFMAVCVESAVPSALKDHAFLVAENGRRSRIARATAAFSMANERQADDETMSELYAQIGRDVRAPQPNLRSIEGGKAA